MTEVPAPPPAPVGGPSSNNGKALTSMILGIVSILICLYWFLAIPLGGAAVALGVISKKEIEQGNGTNKGMAMAGLITGAIGAALGLIGLILVLVGNAIDVSTWS